MSDTVQVALIATLVPSLIALLGFFQSISNGRKTIKIADKVDVVEKKSDTIIVEAAKIHTLANDNYSKAMQANEVLTAKMEELNKRVAMMIRDKDTADLLAADRSRKFDRPVTAATRASDATHPQLKNVDIIPSEDSAPGTDKVKGSN